MIVKLLTEHHLKYLSLKGGCRGSSESSHVKEETCNNIIMDQNLGIWPHWMLNDYQTKHILHRQNLFKRRHKIANKMVLILIKSLNCKVKILTLTF